MNSLDMLFLVGAVCALGYLAYRDYASAARQLEMERRIEAWNRRAFERHMCWRRSRYLDPARRTKGAVN